MIPYTKEQLPSTAEAIVSLINKDLAKLGVVLLAYAKENNTWALPWYYPRKPLVCDIDTLYLEHMEGKFVDVLDPVSLPLITHISPRQTKQFKTGNISVIDTFNDQKQIVDVLCYYRYKHVLTTTDYQRWISPDSTSGRAGITVKDNKLFSHHGDVLNDGYWHDAWDLWRHKENLTEHDAIIQAAQSLRLPDGRTIDEQNKGLAGQSLANIAFNEYQPFNNELLPVESVPYLALPDQLSRFIKEQSLIRGCPDDFILISVLARLGLLFAGKIKIALTRNTSYHASPNFFG